MLVSFIHFEYVRDQPIMNNIAGNQANVQANSTTPSNISTNIVSNYNEGLQTYWSIQWLISRNFDSYEWDLFKGIDKDFMGVV